MFERWVERWNRAIEAARSRGAGDDTCLEIGPPATEKQVSEVEKVLNVAIPMQFRRTLVEFSGRVDFFWFLKRGDDPPPPLSGIFCGGCRWDIDRLVEDHRHVVQLANDVFIEDVPEETLWAAKFPFHAIACGDFIAIDQASPDEQRVVYLGHELAGSHAHWLGADFYDFMDRWTALGCPDDDIWTRFVPERNSYIDVGHPNARLWCEWFGLPTLDRRIARRRHQ